jgi:hypothetical protein
MRFSAYFCLFLQKMCVFVQNRTDGDAKHRANALADHFANVGKMIGQLRIILGGCFENCNNHTRPPVFRSTARFKSDGQEHTQNIWAHSA